MKLPYDTAGQTSGTGPEKPDFHNALEQPIINDIEKAARALAESLGETTV